MKGISTVIATLLMLIITIALASLAYTYITGVWTTRTAVLLSIDEPGTSCTNRIITMSLRNDGVTSIGLNLITISGTSSTGTALTGGACAATGTLAAGSTVTCTTTLTGATTGTNTVKAVGGGSSATGYVYCA